MENTPSEPVSNQPSEKPDLKPKKRTSKTKRLVRRHIKFGFISVACLGLAQVLPAYGRVFLLPATILTFLWLVYAAFSQWRLLRNYEAPNREAFWNSFPYALVAFVICPLLLLSSVKKEPKPHIRIGLLTGTTISDRLELTNEFLIFRGDAGGEIFRKMLGAVLLPVVSSNSTATLKLFAFNESPAVAETITLNVFFPTNLIFTPAKPEPGVTPWESLQSLIAKFQVLGIRTSHIFLPFEQGMCPDLNLQNIDGWTREGMPIVILVRAKNMEDYYVAFWLGCPLMDTPTPPRLVSASRGEDGKMHLWLQGSP